MWRRCSLAFLMAGLASVAAFGATGVPTFEQVTVATTAIGFTAASITPPGVPMQTMAVCRLETAEIRFRYDGLNPTTSVGVLLEVGDYLTVPGHDLMANFRAIRTGATSGVLSCHYLVP